jgi:hypothetical protein
MILTQNVDELKKFMVEIKKIPSVIDVERNIK